MKKIILSNIILLNFVFAGDDWATSCNLGDYIVSISAILFILSTTLRLFIRKSSKLIIFNLTNFMLIVFAAPFSKCIYWNNIFHNSQALFIIGISFLIALGGLIFLIKNKH